MTEVRDTVTRVLNTMIQDHGAEYAACWFSNFLTEVIETDVKDEVAKSMISIRLLSGGINSRLDCINDMLKKSA